MADSDATPETDEQLKKRARRRLVGAAALALFAVIVLPMVMDHEPRPVAPDIQVRIPSQDASFVSRISPGKPVPTPMPPESAPSAPVARPAAPEPAAKTESPRPAEKPAVEKPAEVKPAPAKPVAKAAEAVKTEAPKAEATKPAPAKPDDAGEPWVVQIGTYKNASNVKLLLGKFKEVGVPAYTEKVDSGTRVRVGPFPNRDAAEKAQAKIRRIGVDGPVATK